MTRRRLRPVVICCWLGLTFLLAGCGPREVTGAKLKGQVMKDGQPLKALPGERVWITFERVEPAGKQVIMSSGSMQKDGTFSIEGQEKKGTPPGKYSVTLHGEFSSGEGENRFAPLFAGGTSPFIAEVTEQGDQNFVIDIGTKTIMKQ